jgi:DNA-binding NarL/FixJ family response regulator
LLQRVRDAEGLGTGPAAGRLSSREVEVLELLADGKPDHEIAETLTISADAVRNLISSVVMKLR